MRRYAWSQQLRNSLMNQCPLRGLSTRQDYGGSSRSGTVDGFRDPILQPVALVITSLEQLVPIVMILPWFRRFLMHSRNVDSPRP
jgi:hypothetical protein